MPEFEIVDRNLRAAMRFFGEATGTGAVRALDGVEVIYSGLDYGVFNIATLGESITSRGGGLEARLAECSRFYQPRTPHWSFWLCEDRLDWHLRRRARQVFTECGMRVISQSPGMAAPALRAPSRCLPQIDFRPVDCETLREAFGAITSVCFDIPSQIARAVYQPERAWQGRYRGFVGLVDGKPVTIAAIVAAAGALGVYSLATVPEYRRKGYGEALLRAALARERERTGIETLVLQSTDAGHSLYRRMGFQDVTKFSVYLTK
jgi:GNAT superfamily N-acetyltransferase